MRKTITRKWLKSEGACKDGIIWWEKNGHKSVVETLKVIHTRPSYAEWLLEHLLKKDKQASVKLAIYSAKMCIKNYVGDKAPLRNAIKLAEAVLKNDNPATRSAAARSAASAARSAAWSAASAAAESAAWKNILAYVITLEARDE